MAAAAASAAPAASAKAARGGEQVSLDSLTHDVVAGVLARWLDKTCLCALRLISREMASLVPPDLAHSRAGPPCRCCLPSGGTSGSTVCILAGHEGCLRAFLAAGGTWDNAPRRIRTSDGERRNVLQPWEPKYLPTTLAASVGHLGILRFAAAEGVPYWGGHKVANGPNTLMAAAAGGDYDTVRYLLARPALIPNTGSSMVAFLATVIASPMADKHVGLFFDKRAGLLVHKKALPSHDRDILAMYASVFGRAKLSESIMDDRQGIPAHKNMLPISSVEGMLTHARKISRLPIPDIRATVPHFLSQYGTGGTRGVDRVILTKEVFGFTVEPPSRSLEVFLIGIVMRNANAEQFAALVERGLLPNEELLTLKPWSPPVRDLATRVGFGFLTLLGRISPTHLDQLLAALLVARAPTALLQHAATCLSYEGLQSYLHLLTEGQNRHHLKPRLTELYIHALELLVTHKGRPREEMVGIFAACREPGWRPCWPAVLLLTRPELAAPFIRCPDDPWSLAAVEACRGARGEVKGGRLAAALAAWPQLR